MQPFVAKRGLRQIFRRPRVGQRNRSLSPGTHLERGPGIIPQAQLAVRAVEHHPVVQIPDSGDGERERNVRRPGHVQKAAGHGLDLQPQAGDLRAIADLGLTGVAEIEGLVDGVAAGLDQHASARHPGIVAIGAGPDPGLAQARDVADRHPFEPSETLGSQQPLGQRSAPVEAAQVGSAHQSTPAAGVFQQSFVLGQGSGKRLFAKAMPAAFQTLRYQIATATYRVAMSRTASTSGH